ncbi:MAG: TrmB family transcriptional regulator [Candidatus Diapherotrites archaeon]|nr:TrmB family transcriptional regulator [Candidatus Diapherotrites archaeon]
MNADLSEFLNKLGLTEYESKTLATLFGLKEAQAPDISRIAQVPKTRVYDVLDRLIKKELVIKIYARPKKYKVIEADKVFDTLLSNKKGELVELERQVHALKETLVDTGSDPQEFERVMKVKDKNDFYRILGQELDRAKEEVVGFTEMHRPNPLLSEALRKTAARQVNVKLVGKLSKETQAEATDLARKGVGLREWDHNLHAYLIDNKKLVMALSDFREEKPNYHFTIWNQHTHMNDAIKNHFNACWEKGRKL